MSCLFFGKDGLQVKFEEASLGNDAFVLSKGHAAPILYAALAWIGVIPHEDLKTLRKRGSYLEGHPVPKIPFVDVATGSLGQGLSVAAGMAYSAKVFDKT